MYAIVTRIQPATDKVGTRVRATCKQYTLKVAYNHALDALENHQVAASELAKRMSWYGEWTCGELPTGDMAHTLHDVNTRVTVRKERLL